MLSQSHLQPTLNYIIDQAYKSYKKHKLNNSSFISNNNKQIKCTSSNFNILRVLTQFKQIFPSTPEYLYRQLMIITKKYNPQNIIEWKRAVNMINNNNNNNNSINNNNNNNNMNKSNLHNKNHNNDSHIRSLSSSIISHNHQQQLHQQNNDYNNENSLKRSNKLHNDQQYSIKTYKQQLDNQIDNLQSKRMKLLKISQNIQKNKNNSNIRNKNNIITQPICNQFDLNGVNYIKYQDNEEYEQNKQNNMMNSNRNSININNTQFHHISFQPQYNHDQNNKVIIQSRKNNIDQHYYKQNIIINKKIAKQISSNNNINLITPTPTTCSLRSKLTPSRTKSTIIFPSKSKYSQILQCLPNNNIKKINPYIEISKLSNINMSHIQIQQNYNNLPTSKDYDKFDKYDNNDKYDKYDKYDKKTLYSQNINTSYTNSRMIQNKSINNGNYINNKKNNQGNSNININNKTTRDKFQNNNDNNNKKLRNNSQNTLSTCHNINCQQTRQSFNYKPKIINNNNNNNNSNNNNNNNNNKTPNSSTIPSFSNQYHPKIHQSINISSQQSQQLFSQQQQHQSNHSQQQIIRSNILNHRALKFYQFNTKLKTFSKLLANYQVTQQYKKNKLKSKIFYQSYLLSKCIIAFKANIIIEKNKLEQYQKVKIFYQKKLKKKVWNVLNVLKQLKIEQNQDDMVKKVKNNRIHKYNRLNYQFFIAFMFEEKNINNINTTINNNNNTQIYYQSKSNNSINISPSQSPNKLSVQNWQIKRYLNNSTNMNDTRNYSLLHQKQNLSAFLNTSYNLSKKAQYFSQTHNIQNLWSIYKYFGLNIQISKPMLEQLIKSYQKSLKSLIFHLLLKNKTQRTQKPLKFYQQKLLNKSFNILLQRYKQNKQQNNKENIAIKYRQKYLYEKLFRIMVKQCCQNKVYKKRQKYLEEQKNKQIKRSMFKKWVKQYKSKINKRKENNEMIKKAGDILQRFIIKKSFELLQMNSQHYYQKQQSSSQYYQKRLLKSTFIHLSTLLLQKKKYLNLCHRHTQQLNKSILLKWHQYSLKKHHLSQLSKILSKFLFRTIFTPLNKSIIKQYYLNIQDQRNFNKQIFQKWKIIIQKQKLQRQSNIIKIKKIRESNMIKDVIKQIKRNMKNEKENKKIQEIQIKREIVLINNKKIMQEKVVRKLIKDKKDRMGRKLKLSSLNKTIKHIYIQTFIINSLNNQEFTHKKSSLNQYLNHQYSSHFLENLHSNLLKSKSCIITHNKHHKLLSTFLSSITKKYQNIKQNQQKSIQFYTHKIQQKVLISFVKEYIDINDKTLQIKKVKFILIYNMKYSI